MHQQQPACPAGTCPYWPTRTWLPEVLAGKRLDDAIAGQVLLQRGGEHRFLLLVVLIGARDETEEVDRDRQHERDDNDGQQGQLQVLSAMMAMRLTTKRKMMRALEMISMAKKRRMASTSDVTR